MHKIRVGVPCYGRLHPEVAFSLVAMLDRSGALLAPEKLADYQRAPYIHYRNYCFVDEARNQIVSEVLTDEDCTHLMFIDIDHDYPIDAIGKLVDRSAYYNNAVVGALYFMRNPPFDIVHFGLNRKRLDHLPTGIEEVYALGMGCTLVPTMHLRKMREVFSDSEWFRKTSKQGEDVWFANRLSAMGVKSYVDGTLMAGHISEQLIGPDHWRAAHNGSVIVQPAQPTSAIEAPVCWLDQTKGIDPGSPPYEDYCDFAGLYADVVDHLPNGAVVVELGCFLGVSSIILARLLRYRKITAVLYCVDNFKCETCGMSEEARAENLRRGGGSFRSLFERNTAEAGVRDAIQIIEGDTAKAAGIFFNNTVDFVFVDADHSEQGCRRDIEAWLPRLKSGGVMAGHDFNLVSVRMAVAATLPGAIPRGRNCWIWRKP